MLPPPPPARDLHGARVRITLDKVKLELESVREALEEVGALGEAVKSLRKEVELLARERDERGKHTFTNPDDGIDAMHTDRALQDKVAETVQAACEAHTRSLRANLAPVMQELLDSVQSSERRASRFATDAKCASARILEQLEARCAEVRGVAVKEAERTVRASEGLKELGKLRVELQEAQATIARQAARMDRLEALVRTSHRGMEARSGSGEEPNAAQSSTASNSTRPADKGGRGKLSSLDQRTPTHRRLLLPSRDGDGKKAKELVEVDGARAAKEQEQEQDEQERARAKRRRTIKQDESLGDSANAAMPEDQRASSEGPELDLMGAQQDTGAGGVHEDLGGSQGAGSSEGEPDTQE
ncbi:hypothetical protein JCM8202v2_004131 [Rhodotorula sphaerocarpa]